MTVLLISSTNTQTALSISEGGNLPFFDLDRYDTSKPDKLNNFEKTGKESARYKMKNTKTVARNNEEIRLNVSAAKLCKVLLISLYHVRACC